MQAIETVGVDVSAILCFGAAKHPVNYSFISSKAVIDSNMNFSVPEQF